jgi:hypothetical protein
VSLSDRLNRARTERLLAAGLVHSEAALKPEPLMAPPPVPAEGTGLFSPITIEVRPIGLHTVAGPSELTDVDQDGWSAACPNCNRLGHVDLVDLVGHTTHLTCETCGTMWQVRSTEDQHVG